MACLRVDQSNASLLTVVADIADRFSASVIGVVATQPAPFSAVGAVGPAESRNREVDKFRERTKAVESEFRAAMSKAASVEWRSLITAGPVSHLLAGEGRGADLVVTGSEAGDRALLPVQDIEVSDLIMRVGRPVLIAPPNSQGLKLKRAMVCWKDTREARRAIADALPFLEASEKVDVVELAYEHDLEGARRRLGEIGEWLARHKINANCLAQPLKAAEAAQLRAMADDLNADLVIAGAFGHSRLREWAFGGVTRDLILRCERCALVSH
jgi:nucleotide-binding universal stress UspA family protein